MKTHTKPVTATFAARHFDVPLRTLLRWLSGNLVPAKRSGRTWLVKLSDIERSLAFIAYCAFDLRRRNCW
jgi:hypothetical protein